MPKVLPWTLFWVNRTLLGHGDLEPDHAAADFVADNANVLGARDPHCRVERAVGHVVLDESVCRESRIDAVIEVVDRRVPDELEAIHPAGLDAVARKSFDGEAANVKTLDAVCPAKRPWARVVGDVGMATSGKIRSSVDSGGYVSGPVGRTVVNETDLARFTPARDFLPDQAKVVGLDVQAVVILPLLRTEALNLYVPGSTRIVSPGAATSIAPWMDSPGKTRCTVALAVAATMHMAMPTAAKR